MLAWGTTTAELKSGYGLNLADELKQLRAVRAAAEEMLDAARGSHAWDHTLRVCRLCERIGTDGSITE